MSLSNSRTVFAITLALLLLPILLPAQNRDEWSVYSAVNVTNDVAFDNAGKLWVATTGGVVSFDPDTEQYGYIRTSEGLLRLNSTAIAFDPTSGDMYVGSDDGSISIRKSSGEWRRLSPRHRVSASRRPTAVLSCRGGAEALRR